jgi:hypothetical protein
MRKSGRGAQGTFLLRAGGECGSVWTSMKRCLAALASLCCVFAIRAEIVINEIHYDPDVKTELVEFIELYNTGSTPVDLSGWAFTDAVDYVFPAGTSIAANDYVVVTQNPAQFNAKFRKTALGPWTGSLNNEGEQIVLRDQAGSIVDKVDYQRGFPWPVVGDPPGYSIELVNPAFDNDLGGNWRPSGTPPSASDAAIIPKGDVWQYFKGTQEPSATGAWRQLGFAEDANWKNGRMPVGYDETIPMNTPLADMPGNYSTVYFRKIFNVSDPATLNTLQIQTLYDDGFKVWINGRLVLNQDLPATETPYNGLATGSGRESAAYDTFTLPAPVDYLVPGQNVIAVQLANILLADNPDCFLDLALIARSASSGGVGPSPGARNNSFALNLPPAIRQVDHSLNQPTAGQPVTITAKVTDPEGVASVQLQYQIVDPGNYIELTDSAYGSTWTTVAMADAGTNGDEFPGDSLYTVVLPGSLQIHRRLIRYRIVATDSSGLSITAPYADDACPNFAYFCYNGTPAWSGAVRPGTTQPTTYPASVMDSLPTYHLLSKKASVEASTWIDQYGGDLYQWAGTLVYDGKVYDHIHYRARGGVWRYAMGKNMWKMDFNRGHDFHPKDNWGHEYDVGWTKLNLGACIQQGDYLHRGEQGMFESVGFRLFNLAGVEAPKTHFIHFRIIDEAAETGANQYTGDFWGLYLAVEQEDSRFLEEHDMPDSNFYKMEGGYGTLNNEGPFGPSDTTDLGDFIVSLYSTQPEPWWRDNFDLNRYYSYRTIVEGIHHYDIDGDPGKNYFYYTNSVSHKWEVHPWDLDLTWANNMYGGGNEQFKSRVLPIANLKREYRNRVREIRDLLFNTDQAYQLIDEYAAMINSPGGVSFVGADRAMWDYNPIMISGYVNSSKAGQGRFYQAAATKDFPGMVKLMKDYVVTRGSLLDSQASDTGLPAKPTIADVSPTGDPANRLTFEASEYSGSSLFAAMQWRIGEITPAGRPAYDPKNPRVYEIEPVWQSAELITYSNRVNIPSGVVKVGHTYRARVKMKDALGRWSNWSDPAQFVAGEADNATALGENLRVTEIMYNPPVGSDYEFVELFNASADQTLDLAGAKFTSGIDFTFPSGATLAPGAYCLVTRATSLAAFRNYYSLTTNTTIFGPYSGALNNDGEELTLKTTAAGATIISFTYGNGAAWPIAADGAGHSIVPRFANLRQDASDFSYPGNWRASAYIKGSPGAADPAPPSGPVLNEIMANTDNTDPNNPAADSNDWIELANPSAVAINWTGYYLSDDPVNLKKWSIGGGSISPGAFVSFDEVSGFHNPLTTGFGLDQAGEQVFLSYFPANGPARVVDAVKFKGQSKTNSWSRIPSESGFWRAAAPTRNSANNNPVSALVINEVMYHPATNTNSTLDNTADEYVELYNPAANSVPLVGGAGTYRIDGGIKFQFPAGTTLGAGETLVLVNFLPTTAAASNAFSAKYNLPAGTKLLGPYSGKLSNQSDRLSLERPEPPKSVGEPIAWIVVDEVTYGKRPLWPVEPDGGGTSLHRVSIEGAGNDPADWQSAAPDPGRVATATDDRDGDGMPDLWEIANGLNPDSAADAAGDLDGDGISNLAEFQAGTDPRDPNSGLRIAGAEIEAGQFSARVYVVAGKTYVLERCDDWNTHLWQTVRQLQPTQTGFDDLSDPDAPGAGNRFYRIRLQTE